MSGELIAPVDDETADKILRAIRVGAAPDRAALAFGITIEQLGLIEGVEQAVAQGELLLLERAASGAEGWQAPMKVLERRFPDRWAPRPSVIEYKGANAEQTEPDKDGEVVEETRLERMRREREERARDASRPAAGG